MNINISINNKVATVSGSPVIVCGNSDYTVTFTFDSEWANLPTKQARFSWYLNGEKQFTDVTFTGSTVAVPTLSDITTLYVGVFAGDLHTTTPAKITCRYSALCGSGTKMLKGETGDAATVDVGTVTTGAPGTEAEVENVGTRGAAVLNFKIPAGQTSLASFATLKMSAAPTVGKELAIAYSRLNRTPLVGEYGFSLCVNDTTGDTYMMAFQVQSLNATTAAAIVTAVTSTTGPQGPQGEKGEQGEMGAFIGTWETGTSGTTVLPVAGLYEFKVATPEVPSVTALVNWNGTSASSSLFHWDDRDYQELILGYFYITLDGLVYLRNLDYNGQYSNITETFYYRKLGSAVDDIATTTTLNTEV